MRKNTERTGNKDEIKATLLNFVSEFLNYGAVIATAVLTVSLSIFMDLINSTCNLLRTGICSFLSVKLRKNQSFKYNYGTENLETVSVLLCELLLVIGTGAVMVFAVVRLFDPCEPGDGLLVGVLYKLWCVIADLLILITAYKAYKKSGTKVAKENFEGTLGGTGFDLAIFLSVLAAYVFKGKEYAFVPYIEPVASILIAVFVIFRTVKRVREHVRELTYATLDEKDQMKITKILAHHFDRFEDFFSVNSHRSGKNVYIDFLVSFPQETTYRDIVVTLEAITKDLEHEFADCKVSIVFDSQNALPATAE